MQKQENDETVESSQRCVNCKRGFEFNPLLVPTLELKGVRRPICRHCMAGVNLIRVAKGKPPIPIDPRAYDG